MPYPLRVCLYAQLARLRSTAGFKSINPSHFRLFTFPATMQSATQEKQKKNIEEIQFV